MKFSYKLFYQISIKSFYVFLFTAIFFKSFGTDTCTFIKKIKFAPEYHFNQNLHSFFLQKNKEFKERYFLEWTNFAELAFFSVNNKFFFWGEMEASIGLGKWENKPILFDPREVDAGFGPMFEYRLTNIYLSLGLDHHCFHEIDTLYYTPVYWNRIFIGIYTPYFRNSNIYAVKITGKNNLKFRDRFLWNTNIGYYLHEFFGLDTSVVSWNNDHLFDIVPKAKFIVYSNSWLFAIIGTQSDVIFTRKSGILFRQDINTELLSMSEKFSLALYARWIIVDQLQMRLNKDKLLEIGIKGFF